MAKTQGDYFDALASRNKWDVSDDSKRVEITIGTLRRLVYASHAEGQAFAREQDGRDRSLQDVLGDLFKETGGGPIIGGREG